MYEMHAHLQQDGALLNLMAGETTVRDMGNDNAVLDRLVSRIDAGEIGGPHVIRSGFIEGKSPYSANNGILVDNQQAAVDAVRWYGARGYWQIKIYNSMNPAWVPAMVAEAHKLGMRVAGHVPAFANADQMIVAGYDEMTHINQFMLGWVIGPTEDTRTLFRLTALKRLPALDLQDPKVQHTIQLMVDGHKAIDPTLGIHEQLTQNRDGQVDPGAVDYIEHMPVAVRRDDMKAWVDTSAPGDDQAYRQAFEKMLQTVKMLHDRGVFIVFGTDTGGSFTYHRELELYQRAGFTAAGDPQARHLGHRPLHRPGPAPGLDREGQAGRLLPRPGRPDQGPQGDQDHQHGGEGRDLLLPRRSLSEVRHQAVRGCAEGRGPRADLLIGRRAGLLGSFS